MDGFSILTNRKRAIVALVHSVVFLLIAIWQFAASPARGIWAQVTVPARAWILCGVYALVSAILIWLFVISRERIEKAYFALCTTSATSGLLRIILGDSSFHSGRYIRVLMLMGAVVVGILITRFHSDFVVRNSDPELAETASS